MENALIITCPRRLVAGLEEALLKQGIELIEEDAGEEQGIEGGVRRRFACVRGDERVAIRTIEEGAVPEVVQVLIDLPPVMRSVGFLPEVVGVLHEGGGRLGGPDAFRCGCGYSLFGNTSGRCPECGAVIAVAER